MNYKPQFVEGIYVVDTETSKCWHCMTETEYNEGDPIFFNSECDYQIYCQNCKDPIDHNLTRDGMAYESDRN